MADLESHRCTVDAREVLRVSKAFGRIKWLLRAAAKGDDHVRSYEIWFCPWCGKRLRDFGPQS